MGRGGTAASRRHAPLLIERRRACRGRARLACGWRPRGPAEWASLPEYTREIHGGISCVHGASRPRTGKRLSRRVEHVRASMEDRHEVEVVLSHLPLDPVERRQRVVGSVHSVMLRSEMHQGAPLLRGRGAASLHASIAAARVATRPSCSAAACSHRSDATRGPLGKEAPARVRALWWRDSREQDSNTDGVNCGAFSPLLESTHGELRVGSSEIRYRQNRGVGGGHTG